MTRDRKKKKLPEIGKIQPQAVELEEAVLGAVILERDAYYSVNNILKQDHFYKEQNQLIWKAITTLSNEKTPIDALTISQQLKKTNELEIVGGGYYVMSLTNNIATSANIVTHARIVVQQYIKREIIRLSTLAIANGYEDSTDCFELMESIRKELNILENDVISDKDFDTIEKIGDDFLKELEEKRSGLTPPMITSGLREILGFANSDSILVAARPGMGKTAFLLRCVRENLKNNINQGVFTLEMTSKQLLLRIASAECEIDSENLRDGKLTNEEMNKLHLRINELKKSKLYIDSTASIDIDILCNKARKMKRDYNIQILFIDYLGLITTTKYEGQKTNEVGYVSRKLKQLAKELDIPILPLVQLSRKIEDRKPEDRMPRLSDLRDSGDLEQDADQVIFLFRPQYYGMQSFFIGGNEIDVRGKAFIEYAKNRHGSTLTAMVNFIGKYTDFRSNSEFSENNDII